MSQYQDKHQSLKDIFFNGVMVTLTADNTNLAVSQESYIIPKS